MPPTRFTMLQDQFSFVFGTCRIFGLVSFSISVEKSFVTIAVSKPWFIYSCVICLAVFISMMMCNLLVLYKITSASILADTLSIIRGNAVWVNSLNSVYNAGRIIRIVRRLNLREKSLVTWAFAFHLAHCIVYTFGLIVLYRRSVKDTTNTLPRFLLFAHNIVPYVLHPASLYLFVYLVNICGKEFKMYQRDIDMKFRNGFQNAVSESLCRDVRILKRRYLYLVNTGTMLDRAFWVSNLSIILVLFSYILVILYHVPNLLKSLEVFLSAALTILIMAFELALLYGMCHWASGAVS